jgi:hypothetical protein
MRPHKPGKRLLVRDEQQLKVARSRVRARNRHASALLAHFRRKSEPTMAIPAAIAPPMTVAAIVCLGTPVFSEASETASDTFSLTFNDASETLDFTFESMGEMDDGLSGALLDAFAAGAVAGAVADLVALGFGGAFAALASAALAFASSASVVCAIACSCSVGMLLM